jgi:S1-C subfamily serine protease
VQEDARFCGRCGTAISVITQPIQTASAPPATRESTKQAPPPGEHPSTMRPRHAALIAVAMTVVLVMLGAGATLVVGRNLVGRNTAPPAAPAAAAAIRSPSTTSPSPAATSSAVSQTFPALYSQVSDGVVRIETTACNDGGVGTGFLVAPDLVATVAHVVDGAVSIVIRANGTTTTGTVVGIDDQADLALVQTPIPLSGHVFALDTGQPLVGTDVGLIGYPLAGPESLAKGSVSGLGRSIDVNNSPLGGLIQTDAAVNPGNSGGPLLAVDGTVVGLVDAMASGANGIGYAIPAQSAASELQGWRESPTPSPASAGCQAPVGPSGVTIGVTDQSGSPDGPSLAAMFSAYADGINTGDYTGAYGLLSAHAQSLTSLDAFSQGEFSSYIVTLSIMGVTHAGRQDSADVAFTSVQDPAAGGHQQSCSNWKMTYTLIPNGSSWLIDTATPHLGSPGPC